MTENTLPPTIVRDREPYRGYVLVPEGTMVEVHRLGKKVTTAGSRDGAHNVIDAYWEERNHE
jgi:hypothetical protein